MKINFALRVVLWFLLLAYGTSARAQTAAPDCGSNPTCLSLFKQGRAQSGIGNLDEAFRLYTRAYAIEADPDLLFSIARVLQKQGSTAAAIVYYRKFLGSDSQATEQRNIAQEYLRQFPDAGPPIPPRKPELTGVASTRAANPGSEAKPVYKKWWFWTIIATVAAAGIAGGIAGGVIASQQCQPPACSTFTPVVP